MINNYSWIRHVDPPTPFGGIASNVSNAFPVYMSDFAFGVRVNWQVESSDAPGTYYWRFRVLTAYARLIDIEIEYTFARSGASITSETLRARTWNQDGSAPASPFAPRPVTGNGPGNITFDALFPPSSVQVYPPGSNEGIDAETYETIFPGTTSVQYERRDSSYSLLAGGIGTSGGSLGIGGFDVRTLAIKNLRADKLSTNLSSDENTVNFLMDIYALPGATSLFPAWTPASDVEFEIQVGNLLTTELYYNFYASVSAPAAATDGFITSISLPPAFRWPGKDLDGNVIASVSGVVARAAALNPDGIPTATLTQIKETRAMTYLCSSCENGGVYFEVSGETSQGPHTESFESAANYSALNSDLGTASLGYGWSSEASNRIIGGNGELVFKTSKGGYIRWVEDPNNQGSYLPFSPGNYTEAAVDLGSSNARYKLTFKDQTVYEFDVDGKLRRKVDRNNNALVYEYNLTTGHLETISDGNGRSHHYTNDASGQPLTLRVNDPVNGRLTRFEYHDDPDIPDRLHKIIDPEGNEVEFIYYPLSDPYSPGRLFQVIDKEGKVASAYAYDIFGRVLAEISYGKVQRNYFYEPNSLEIVEQDLSPVAPEPVRRLYKEFDKLGNTVRIIELVDPDAAEGPVVNETILTYNDATNPSNPPDPYLLVHRLDPNLTHVEMTYTNNGNLKTYKDKGGNVTTYTYAEELETPPSLNPKHRNLVREIQRPQVSLGLPSVTTYEPTVLEYDINGNLERIIDARGTVTGKSLEMTYDLDGKLLSIKNRMGHTTEFHYDGLPFSGSSRNLLEVRTPKGDDVTDGVRVVEFEYDDYDNVVIAKDDMGNRVVRTYDGLDRTVSVETRDASNALVGGTTQFDYPNSLLETVTMPPNNGSAGLERNVQMVYDFSNRLSEVHREKDANTSEMRVRYGYTSFDDVRSLTRLQNGNERSFSFSYDRLGRQLTAADSLPTPTTGVTHMAYAPYCNENTTTSARGIRRRMVMEDRCLPLALEVGDVYPNQPLELLNPREVRGWEHDELGRMVQSSQSLPARYNEAVFGAERFGAQAEVRQYLYDELDRLEKLTFEDGSEISWLYDDDGKVVQVTDPMGKVTEYSYYRDNLLKQVLVKRPPAADRIFTYTYDPAGRLLQIEYPQETEVVVKFDDGTNTPGSGWDAKGQLLHLRYEKDGVLIRRLEFGYDESGNRASLLDITDGATLSLAARAVKWEYTYDWLDRLVSVHRSEAPTAMELPIPLEPLSAYSYDESDNRKTYQSYHNGLPDKLYRYVMDEANNLVETWVTEGSNPEVLLEEFEKDADGNMTSRIKAGETITYEWDDFDRLTAVSSSIDGQMQDSRYDATGIRKRKVDRNGNSSTEYSVGISTSSERAGAYSTKPSFSYIMGHQILGYEEEDGVFRYFLPDALGSVRDIVDSNGDVVQSYEFNEHGLSMPGSGSGSGAFSPKTYQGGLSVNDDRNDSGLYLMGHRHYAAELGRFISRDPIGFNGGLNLFNGAGTSPMTMVDPQGLDCEITDRAIGREPFTNSGITTAKEFKNYIKNGLPNHSITKISVLGHGSETWQSFDPIGQSDEGFQLHKDSGQIYLRGKDVYEPLAPLLKDKLAEGARIELRGCHTAGADAFFDPAAVIFNWPLRWLGLGGWIDALYTTPGEYNIALTLAEENPGTAVGGMAGPYVGLWRHISNWSLNSVAYRVR